jgi:hypothetical protein
VLPPAHQDILTTLFNLAEVLHRLGRHAEAEPLVREHLTGRLQQEPRDAVRVVEARTLLAAIATSTWAYPAAETALLEAWGEAQTSAATPPALTRWVVTELVRLYDEWHASQPGAGFDGKGAEWRARLVPGEGK